jgi:hypothetical protein
MAFTSASKGSVLRDGEVGPLPANDPEVLLSQETAAPKAFQNTCPYPNSPLREARFDDKAVTRGFRQWRFDPSTPKGIHSLGCDLLEYPVRLTKRAIQVDWRDTAALFGRDG